ncbi:MAG: lolA [Flavipsychrobacter sp.]|jgi:outer membrane lipoprotein-sorting protein|nr:lolA [Flavipsychrobacter sp.]
MKKLLFALVLGIGCAAQPVMAQNDTKAKTILEAVSKKINGLKTLKANFTLTLTGGKGGSVKDSKKGAIAMKGQKYRVTISNQEIICDAKTVWTYNKDAKEVQVTNYNPQEQSMSPAKLFTNFYDKEYKYSYKGDTKEQGKNCDLIELIPNDKSKQLSKIELMVEKSSSTILGGNYWEKNGNKYKIAISNYKPNVDIPDTYFAWDTKQNPGVEVVDLR